MSNTRTLLAAIPVTALALALAACSPPEESPPMDPPADVETTPADDPWTQAETDDPTRVDPVDPWDQQMPPEDGPPTLDQPPTMIEPTTDPTDEQVPPPEPEDAGDPIDP